MHVKCKRVRHIALRTRMYEKFVKGEELISMLCACPPRPNGSFSVPPRYTCATASDHSDRFAGTPMAMVAASAEAERTWWPQKRKEHGTASRSVGL